MTSAVVTALLLGVGVGVGLVIVGRSFTSRPAPLGPSLQHLEAVGLSVAGLDRGDGDLRRRRTALRQVSAWGRLHAPADLAVAGRSAERHGMEKVASSIALAAIPLLGAVVLRVGGLALAPGITTVLVLLGAVGGVMLPEITLVSQARSRRRGFRHALSGYLDLVNVLLAGGAGVETALTAAADAGDGWVFEHLRDVLVRARTSRLSPWAAFADLGRHLAIDDLVELASSVELAGEQGARIRMSLVAKAEALRGRQGAEIEADAQAATERMGLPTVLMFLGFLVLLGYPAAVMVVGGIGG